MSFEIHKTARQDQSFAASLSNETAPAIPKSTSSGTFAKHDALTSYAKVEQDAGGCCIVDMLRGVAECVRSLFRSIFCCCFGSKKGGAEGGAAKAAFLQQIQEIMRESEAKKKLD